MTHTFFVSVGYSLSMAYTNLSSTVFHVLIILGKCSSLSRPLSPPLGERRLGKVGKIPKMGNLRQKLENRILKSNKGKKGKMEKIGGNHFGTRVERKIGGRAKSLFL